MRHDIKRADLELSGRSASRKIQRLSRCAAAELKTNLWYWRHALVRLEGIKVQVEKRLSRTLVGLQSKTAACEEEHEDGELSHDNRPGLHPPAKVTVPARTLLRIGQ